MCVLCVLFMWCCVSIHGANLKWVAIFTLGLSFDHFYLRAQCSRCAQVGIVKLAITIIIARVVCVVFVLYHCVMSVCVHIVCVLY